MAAALRAAVSFALFARPYKIIHFQRSNGFPANYVHQVFQDSRNYIWMATDNGLVCYNGYAFKSFTKKDGLPDNEVFGICEDIRHRLWLTPFAKEVCYLWKGKVYNRHNDPVLRQVELRNIALHLGTDRWSNIFTQRKGWLHYARR